MPLPVVAYPSARYVVGAVITITGFASKFAATGRFRTAGTTIPPADHRAGHRRHLWAHAKSILAGLDARLPGPSGCRGEFVGDRADGADAVGDQCGRRGTRGALFVAEIRRSLPDVQRAGAEVGLRVQLFLRLLRVCRLSQAAARIAFR